MAVEWWEVVVCGFLVEIRGVEIRGEHRIG
jgi:hypothetical protein